MIVINNLEILNNGSELAIDVETNAGYNITSILLWKMDDFKDYSLSIDLSSKIEAINNKEIFIVTAEELNIPSFDDILFLEVESDYENPDSNCTSCQDPALGVTYNLSPYYSCLLSYFLEDGNTDCTTCNDGYNNNMVITINMLIDMVEKGLEVGYYTQAIDMVNKLKKLCSIRKCNGCKPVNCNSCSSFIQY